LILPFLQRHPGYQKKQCFHKIAFLGILFAFTFISPLLAQSSNDTLITKWTPISGSTMLEADTSNGKAYIRQLKQKYFYTLFTSFTDSVQLPHSNLAFNSVNIYFDHHPISQNRYRIDYKKGIVYLRYLFNDTHAHRLDVFYKVLPFGLKHDYSKREFRYGKSSTNGDTLKVLQTKSSSQKLFQDIFSNSSIRKSGTIIRGVTIGTNQDLTVNSGLRLQLDGTLTPGVEVTAALTDESTPIQPEGNTQTLQEFDRVFVEIRSKYAEVTLGDFNLSLQNTEFASLNRKLQGGKILSRLDIGSTSHEVQLGFASSRGKYHVNQFNGEDGNQGPYRLTDKDGEPFIVVLAGTEKVFVDGQEQTRGQDNDYIIDYGSGEITFMNRRLITAESKIIVDFQYTDRMYQRSFLGFKSKNSFFNDAITFQTTILNESDDKDSPIDLTLSDANIQTLKFAGADESLAIDTTAYVGYDSDGKPAGLYIKKDTTVSSQTISIYVYEPSSSEAFWIPSFSYVGTGNGSYDKLSLGIFEYVGPNLGSYEAYFSLPFPESQSLFDLDVKIQPFKNFTLVAEGALSKKDQNTFSTIDDSTNDGNAYKLGFTLNQTPLKILGHKFGTFSLNAYQKETSKYFAFFDRSQPVDYATNYNLIDYSGNTLFDEITSEKTQTLGVEYSPIQPVFLNYDFGRLVRGRLFESKRQSVSTKLNIDSLTTTTTKAVLVESSNDILEENANWLLTTASSNMFIYPFSRSPQSLTIMPFVSVEYSDKQTKHTITDTLRSDSHEIIDVTPGITFTNFFSQEITASFKYRHDQLFYASDGKGARLIPASFARTQKLNWRIKPGSAFFAKANLTRRVRHFTKPFRMDGNVSTETLLLELNMRTSPFKGFTDLEWYYNVSTEKTSKTDRQFFAVQQGDGSYVWRDQNNNELKEFDEFYPINYSNEIGDDSLQYVLRTFPSDELIPIIDLKTNLRLRLKPQRLIKNPNSFTAKTLAAISTESVFRIEEKSTETDLKQIYLMNFDKFLNDSTTLSGKISYQQDVYLFENELTNFRFRYLQTQSLTQYSLNLEKDLLLERSIRFLTRLGGRLGFELNLASSYNRSRSLSTSSSYSSSGREYEILGYNVAPNISYRPFQDWEIALLLSYDDRTDRQPLLEGSTKPVSAVVTSVSLGSTYSFRGKGRLKAEIERTSAAIENEDLVSSTYELTLGNVKGETYIWNLYFDYRLSQFITASLNYDGRSLPEGNVIHTGKAEIRAVF